MRRESDPATALVIALVLATVEILAILTVLAVIA